MKHGKHMMLGGHMMSNKAMSDNMKLGGGGRFKALVAKLKKKKGLTNPSAVAASIGRKKYGKARFQKLAALGKKNG